MFEAYNAHVAERAALGIPALPLSKDQTAELVKMLKNPPAGKESELVELSPNVFNAISADSPSFDDCKVTMGLLL